MIINLTRQETRAILQYSSINAFIIQTLKVGYSAFYSDGKRPGQRFRAATEEKISTIVKNRIYLT